MLKNAYDILTAFPVRKSKKQKEQFRQEVQDYLQTLGYSSHVESGSFGCKNVVAGDPENAKYLVTAHYDTCARMVIPNLITPCNFWLFIAYQLLVVLFIMVPSIGLGALTGLLFRDFLVGYVVFMVFLWGDIILMMVGPANSSNVNDNTSGVVSVLEIAKSLPESYRKDVCFVLFDLEEAGLIGSAAYQKAHKKATASQLILNLDCVGEGDELYFFPTKKLKKDAKQLSALEKLTGTYGKKTIAVRKKGFAIYPSDQAHFPYGVGICALNRSRMGLYLSKIHTPKDTVLDETNVNLLRAGLVSLITGTAAK